MTSREKLLNAARKLFAESGLHNLTVDDITATAGVSKGTFYTYFKRKEDIVYAICREPFNQIGKRFMDDTDTDIVSKLHRYFEAFTAEVQRYGINVCREWLRDMLTPAAVTDTRDARKWFYDTDMLRDMLISAVNNGELVPDTPVDLLTHLIISQMYGMMTCWCISNQKFNPKHWAKKFADLQLNTIIAPYLPVAHK